MTANVSIDKLEGSSNYRQWKFAMRMLLVHEELYFVVVDDELKPEHAAKDQKALAKICLSVKPSVYPHISQAQTAKEAWSALEKAYSENALQSRISVMRRLFSTRRVNFSTMDDYVLEIVKLSYQLTEMNHALDDELIAVIMLSGLPPDMDPMVMAIENSQTKLTTDDVKSRLLAEATRRSETTTDGAGGGESSGSSAFYAGKSKPKIICFRCNGQGHIARFCGKQGTNNFENNSSNNSNQRKGSEKGKKQRKDRKEAFLTALPMAESFDPDSWYIDSAATKHFSHLQPDEVKSNSAESVKTAGKDVLKCNGIGDFKMNCTTGQKLVKNVHIVPNIRANLLSVGQICDQDNIVVFKKNKCLILDAEGATIKGDRIATGSRAGAGELYKLDVRHKRSSATGYHGNGEALAVVTRQQSKQQASTSECPEPEQPKEPVRLVKKKKAGTSNDSEIPAQRESAPKEEEIPAHGKKSKTPKVLPQDLWHRRTAHGNHVSLKLLKDKLALGISYPDETFENCVACLKGKMRQKPFPTNRGRRAKEKLELVHSDLIVINKPSFSGCRYIFTLIDDYTRKTWVYFLKEKSEVLEYFIDFKNEVENETGLKIKCWRTDRGGEFLNRKTTLFLQKHGIKHEMSCAWTPQQNGTAERKGQDITNRMRAVLQDSGLDDRYWAEAANYVVHVLNRMPTKVLVNATPESLWSGKDKLNLSYFRVFGSPCYSYQHNRRKLDPKAALRIFVGYSDTTKGYRVLNPDNNKVDIERSVVFLENDLYKNLANKEASNSESVSFLLSTDEPDQPERNAGPPTEERRVQSPTPERNVQPSAPEVLLTAAEDQTQTSGSDSGNEQNISEYLPSNLLSSDSDSGDSSREQYETRSKACELITDEIAFSATLVDNEPLDSYDALTGRDKVKWREAMNVEMKALTKNKTWDKVDLPPGKKAIGCKWVFKIKRSSVDGSTRYKARVVAKGYLQRENIDYQETYSPTVRMNTLRLLLGLAQTRNLRVDHLDVVSAFLSGYVDQELYMEYPEGYKNDDGKVCKLNKAIYGLKQSSRCFYTRITEELIKLGFKRSEIEPCVFIKGNTIISIFVDDLLLFTDDENEREEIKKSLSEIFEMRDLGEVSEILGIRIKRENSGIALDQASYICKLLTKFNMTDCKPVNTPMTDENIPMIPESPPIEPDQPYKELIGSLQYLSICTRFDITFSVNKLARYNQAPSQAHWTAAKRILRYLKGTLTKKLVFQDNDEQLNGFVDSDWAGDVEDRKSTSGFVLMLGRIPVSWESRKQKCVATSTFEAEYMAYSEIVKESSFIRQLYASVTGQEPTSLLVFTDSQSAMQLATNPMLTKRSKHMEIRYHKIRQEVEEGRIVFDYLPTEKMLADCFTKPLSSVKFNYCSKEIGLED